MPSNNESENMRRAISLALESIRRGGGPFAALVLKNGVLIAEGTNQVVMNNDPTAHAEVVAIRAACAALGSFQLTGCEVYTTCEPCAMCFGAIYWARPARIIYASLKSAAAAAGFDDGFIEDELRLSPSARSIPARRLLEEEGNVVFRVWTAKGDRVQY